MSGANTAHQVNVQTYKAYEIESESGSAAQ